MNELSHLGKLFKAMDIAKVAQVGMELTYHDVVALSGEMNRQTARIAELEAEVTKGNELQDSYCDRIAKLEAYVAELEAEKRGEK